MRAVLAIVDASPELILKARPYINEEREEIDWQSIFERNDISDGYRAALFFASTIWNESLNPEYNSFKAAHAMDDRMTLAVLKAIEIWLGVDRGF